MINDTQYEYLIKFFDAGSLDRMRREMGQAEKQLDKLSKKADNLRSLTSSLGFGNDPKSESAANSFVSKGSAEAARKNALVDGELARRKALFSNQIIKLQENNLTSLRKGHTFLKKQQVIEQAQLTRQEFLNIKVTNLKQAQVAAEAAKLRTAIAFDRRANNTDGRSTNRLSRELASAQGDEAAAVANAERLNSIQKRNVALANNRQKIQAQLNATIARANAQNQQGNVIETRREVLKARQLQINLMGLKSEKLTTLEISKQVAAQNKLNLAKAKFDADNTQDARLADGGARLFKIQAQLLANYAAMGAALSVLAFAGRFVLDLDKEFAQLQAITNTTDQAMGGLKDTIIEVSEVTKFTALEVAEAATILGQAGFSTDDIQNSIQSITLLATAVGSDLQTTVDLVTSTISVFNLRATEAGNVADVFTAAVNNSKLNLEKLTLGLQYSGNIANEQNISFSELTATLGAMANSGIRAGSTLGTGLRQILTALAAPSEKLQNRLQSLGLTTSDVDVKLHGFTGVLKNLQNAGFTTSDAMQVLEVRAGAAFAALSNNSGTIEDLREKFLLSTAAAKANEVQMEALANKGARLTSVFGTLAYSGLSPLIEIAKGAVDILAFLLSSLNKLGPVVPVLTTTIVGLGFAMVGTKVKILLANTAMLGTIKTMVATRVTAASLAITFKSLAASLGPIGIALVAMTAAVTIGKAAYDGMTTSVDELQSRIDSSTGKIDTYQQNMSSLNKEIERLTTRHFGASTSMQEVNNIALELQQKFGDLGANFNFTTGELQLLVPELERLLGVMEELEGVQLQSKLIDNKTLQSTLQKSIKKTIDRSSTTDFDSPQLQEFSKRLGSDENIPFSELQGFNQQITRQLSVINTELLTNKPEGKIELAVLERQRRNLNSLQGLMSELLTVAKDTKDTVLALEQKEFQETNPIFNQAEADLQKANAQFTELKNSKDKEATKAFIEQLESGLGTTRSKFSGANLARFDASDFTQQYEGLRHLANLSITLTEGQLREEADLHRLRMEASQSDINNILADVGLKRNAIAAATDREKALSLLEAKQLQERTFALGELERKHSSEAIVNANKAALDRKEAAERQKIVDAFDKADLSRVVRTQGASFAALELALNKEIAFEKKKVTTRTSVAEIEAAKAAALEAQTELEIASREDLRFRLKNESDRLPFELEKLNNQLAIDRESLGASFDTLHADITDKASPRLKDSISKLTNAFDKGREEFENKVQALQNPVNRIKATREAIDATGVADKFSDVHRRQLDRQVEQAEISAMRAELDLFKTQRVQELASEQARLVAKDAQIAAQITTLQGVLANYNGGDNSTSQVEAKKALAEINTLTTAQTSLQGELLDKKKEVYAVNVRIADLERDIGIATGASAPAKFSISEGLTAGIQDYVNQLEAASITSDKFADKVADVSGVMTTELGNAFFDIATGAKSVGEAFGDMAKAVVSAILKILAEQVAIFAIKQLFGAFGFTPQSFSGGGQIQALSGGGNVKGPQGFNRGGRIPSLGVTGRDAVPIMAEAGEFMIRKRAADSIGIDKLHSLNTLGSSALDRDMANIILPDGAGGSKEVNVYIVAPDEKPTLGPDDILQVIGQDITTGGQTKQLIKQVILN